LLQLNTKNQWLPILSTESIVHAVYGRTSTTVYQAKKC